MDVSNIDRIIKVRNGDDALETQQIQPYTRLPSEQVVDELTNDYKYLTDLMKRLDVEVGSLTGHMRKVSNNTTNFAGLTKLWDEQTKTIDQEIKEFQTDTDPDNSILEKKK